VAIICITVINVILLLPLFWATKNCSPLVVGVDCRGVY
jgi:hypothetical protein